MSKSLLAWHFLPDTRRTRFDDTEVFPGQTLKIDPPVELCSRGYHASVRPLDALQFAPGAIVCRVKLHGTIVKDVDKAVATRRTCLWMADATRTLHEFAIWSAEQALELIRKREGAVDPRSEMALHVKRLWLDGKATDQELTDAAAAADAAARVAEAAARVARATTWATAADDADAAAAADAAARVAEAAARVARAAAATAADDDAARVANAAARVARATTWATTWTAAGVARATATTWTAAAAWDAAWDDQNAKLEEMLLALEYSQYAIKPAVAE